LIYASACKHSTIVNPQIAVALTGSSNISTDFIKLRKVDFSHKIATVIRLNGSGVYQKFEWRDFVKSLTDYAFPEDVKIVTSKGWIRIPRE